MKPFTYLLINFFTVIVCFVFSFNKRIRFDRYFLPFIKASTIVAIPFIIWDIYFTRMGVWWFNMDYTINKTICGLPIEEWLFFICIPFSCVFTFFCLEKFIRLDWANAFNNIIVFLSTIVCSWAALMFHTRIYTLATAIATLVTLLFLHFVAKAEWLGKASLVFLILMLGFVPVNGVLTGMCLDAPIVNYNPGELLNIRLITIPIEDAVYGYSQFLLNIYFFKVFQKANKSTL